ncbi:thiamine phosphate synthase [Qipengyuania sp. XHP0207]|uniref:thiamine phosphate synthase n=1 Tax=Qipengyuania sp. XHP0207 TaxID=3038078 RepID=UPI00241FBDA6|nr:thiamine phosphate synthase [Qipengyuania sp. XHP0207]MDG5747863.1 thiamine phosphate synthase [Qipengyuania sp. XHP0207]
MNGQALPLLWLLSDARNDGGLEEALRALPERSGFVFRHYHLDPEARRTRFDELVAIARACGHVVILSGSEDWGADGHYGAPESLGSGLRLATAHDGEEIEAAVEAKADGIFLSPVFPTASHPGGATLGPMGFSVLAQQSPVPVIALGGMNADRARELNWPRWAAIDGLS